MISKDNAGHYVWGDNCDGWYLVNRQDMLVIHEKNAARHIRKATLSFRFQTVFLRASGRADNGTGR